MVCGLSCQLLRHPLMAALVLVLLIAASAAMAAGPVIEPAKAGTQCVAPPEVMRRDHPAMLRHQRDVTVHRGVRQARDSLQGCVNCHASAATGSVAQAKTDFCSSCHGYAAVKIDCFECHASKPGQRTARVETKAEGGKP